MWFLLTMAYLILLISLSLCCFPFYIRGVSTVCAPTQLLFFSGVDLDLWQSEGRANINGVPCL